ncbi:MAG TPA: sugar ABC transporter permease [Mesotoga sp.]|jgi:oligogalacturonide transport system permease protein|nr:sugar ABC transporter permease [Mesotoga sp.]MDI9376247.1 sugar ABC transporter permease [Thermotogota bacterium]MDD4040593.1 sugar ABC transporter permease [Mesotoga sp.]MDD4479496.1 sugar ABC transporter permease [Mesotoga sp.]MDD5744628.1 sugar ABC transporter permease [Mesotoga sp.]
MKIKIRTREALQGLAFVSPWLIGFLIFTLVPLVRTFWLSLNEVRVTASGIRTFFMDLKNYRDAFLTDVTFSGMLIDYALQMAVYIPVIISFSMAVALLLNLKIKGQGLFRTIFFLPVIISSGPVLAELADKGAMTFEGLTNLGFLVNLQTTLPPSIARLLAFAVGSFIVILWFSGVQILIYLASLQKIDRSMYEAARIDGASGWQILWKLTIPSLIPITFINIVYTIVTVSTFSTSAVIQKIQTDMYRPEKGLGYASALSWIYFLVMLAIIGLFVLINVIYRKKGGERS